MHFMNPKRPAEEALISRNNKGESEMKILFIGGTGTISQAITRSLVERGDEVTLVNRGNRNGAFAGKVNEIHVSDVNNEEELTSKINAFLISRSNAEALNETVGQVPANDRAPYFDAVCDFICFHKEQAERDFRVFQGKTKQFFFISSASAYHKPVKDYMITEGTTLANPYWQYSREKIEIEEYLLECYKTYGFPVTLIRPSHTYDERSIPLGVHGKKGSYQVIDRMLKGKPVIIHGDGTSLWRMTFNEDFAKGFVGLIGNSHAIGEAFHITNEETLTWNQIYETIAKALNVELKPYYVASEFLASCSDYDFTGSLIGDKSNSVVFDNTKLRRAVPGLNMNIRFEDGIKRTVDYVLSHPECQIPDPEFDAWCDKVIEKLEEAKKAILAE